MGPNMPAYRLATVPTRGLFRASTLLHPARCRGQHIQLNAQVARGHGLQFQRVASVIDAGRRQTRFQSTSDRPQEPKGQQSRPPPPPKPTFRQILFAIMGGGFRNLRNAFYGESLGSLFRKNPEELILALVWYV